MPDQTAPPDSEPPAPAVRAFCTDVAAQGHWVRVREDRIAGYAAALPTPERYPPPVVQLETTDAEVRAAFHLTLAAVNFGSGWFPTLRKRAGRSGFFTVALGIRDHGPWSVHALECLEPREVALATGQDPYHALMGLYALHLNALGARVRAAGSFLALATRPKLAEHLSTWPSFTDPGFYKRAQLTAYDMVCAGLVPQGHEGDLTMFADNLVPHVLRLDGLLEYEPQLESRIEREELLAHGSSEEIEIRACAVRAVELICAARADLSAPAVDNLLWRRGQEPAYKAAPRHRARCSAY